MGVASLMLSCSRSGGSLREAVVVGFSKEGWRPSALCPGRELIAIRCGALSSEPSLSSSTVECQGSQFVPNILLVDQQMQTFGTNTVTFGPGEGGSAP